VRSRPPVNYGFRKPLKPVPAFFAMQTSDLMSLLRMREADAASNQT
jgi:hypothetical protein